MAILAFYTEQKVGDTGKGYSDWNGKEHRGQPWRVVAESDEAAFREQYRQAMGRPFEEDLEGMYFYEVHTD